MESGKIVEYIDRQKILCAMVMEMKNQRLRLLTENNREVKLGASRLLYIPEMTLAGPLGRDAQVIALKETAERRAALSERVDIQELWEVLREEAEWIDLETMAGFCFLNDYNDDHRAAVIRAFFRNRIYFKFNNDRFFPHTPEQVEQIQIQEREEARRRRVIEAGGQWLEQIRRADRAPRFESLADEQRQWLEIIKSVFLFEKESPHCELGRAMLQRAGIDMGEPVFNLLTRAGVWSPDENIDLYRLEVPIGFSEAAITMANALAAGGGELSKDRPEDRMDLTGLTLITIDGQSTLDFDDALSIEPAPDGYRLGVHIADVGHFIKRGDPIDREALGRGSSIYMPDGKIPMLPPNLAEDRCSLKAGEPRPAISTLIDLTPGGRIMGHRIVPSLIRVRHQLSYYDVNLIAEENAEIALLHDIARNFRRQRLSDGAVQITLPEINIWINGDGGPNLTRTNRESPGRLLVSEIMIMANWLMANFLAERGIPAIFRSQPEPRERLFKDTEGTLFQNWMQRKHLSRFALGSGPERHSGLGVNAYVTATSPIRKCFDLITQRQIRSAFGLETPYTAEEIGAIIAALDQPMSAVSQLQNRRKRYWLLKYLEGKVGERTEAIVLGRRKGDYLALITEYLVECLVPASGGVKLKPEDVIQVTLQHVDARRDVFTVFMT